MRETAKPGRSRSISPAARQQPGGLGGWTIALLASFIDAASLHAEDSHAADHPAAAAAADASAADSLARLQSADALTVDHPANDGPSADHGAFAPVRDGGAAVAALATDPGGGDGSDHGLASDGSFWFDANAGMMDLRPLGDGGVSPADGSAPVADAAAADSILITDMGFAAAGSGSFASSTPGLLTHDSGAAHSGPAGPAGAIDASGATTPLATVTTGPDIASLAYFANGAPTAAVAGGATSHAAPSSPQSDAPVLAWLGDIGSGPTNGAGSGGGAGSGSGGTPAQNADSGSGLVIDVIYDPSVANAPAGFTTAVAAVVSYFESIFSNPVTVTIDVGYGEIDGEALASGALGESETFLTSVSYAQLQSALVDNANAIGDTAAAASLPASSPVSGQFWVATAEAAALGLPSASTDVDGYVGFSATPNLFAYDDSSGVPANQYDFFGVVAHEISEVMGRQVLVGENFYGSTGYEPLDLFHYSAPGVRDFSGTIAGYASPDGGLTDLDNFNTRPNGDFGDWAPSAGHDSFLAFSSSGVVNAVTPSDIAVMNLLGWDSQPPPVSSSPPLTVADEAHDMLKGTVSESAADGVLANDSDSDPAAILSVSAVDNSTANVGNAVKGVFGTLTLDADGSFSYSNTHPGLVALMGGVAEDTFNYTVSNGEGGTANSTLTVLITAPRDTYITGLEGSAIQGGTGLTVLDGSAGDMQVTAGSGAHQWLIGGPGDTLTGGSAADAFMFAPGFGNETIDNFNTAQDAIDLPKSLFANFAAVQADMQTSGADTVITLDATDSITLSHVAAQNLQAQNFHFIV